MFSSCWSNEILQELCALLLLRADNCMNGIHAVLDYCSRSLNSVVSNAPSRPMFPRIHSCHFKIICLQNTETS